MERSKDENQTVGEVKPERICLWIFSIFQSLSKRKTLSGQCLILQLISGNGLSRLNNEECLFGSFFFRKLKHSCALKLNYEWKLQHWPYFETSFLSPSFCLIYIKFFIYLLVEIFCRFLFLLTYIAIMNFSKFFFRMFSLLISLPAISVIKFSLFQRSLFGTLFNLSFSRFFVKMIRNGFSLQHHLFSSFILSVILFSKSMERV